LTVKKALIGVCGLTIGVACGAAAANDGVTTYESLSEGFLGGSFDLNGVHYRDCNNVAGVFPDGSTFTAQDIGYNFIIENSTYLFNDFPSWGSPINTLTFGTAYVNGPNLSLGAFATAWMDLASLSNSVSMDMAFYENGPWGGIVFHLDAVRNGQVVGSDTLTIANGGGRDHVTTAQLSVSGVEFDSVHIYATFGSQYSAPRLLIDNLTFGAAPACGSADFDGDGDVGTDADIEAFFACLAGSCCATCGSADFNADGDVGTDADIEAFFRVLGGGPC
jgi:hypothetical protein